jgi:hypothetical protein
MKARISAIVLVVVFAAMPADAHFRRGMLGGTNEVTLSPYGLRSSSFRRARYASRFAAMDEHLVESPRSCATASSAS